MRSNVTTICSAIAIALGGLWGATTLTMSAYVLEHGFPDWLVAYSKPWGTPKAFSDALFMGGTWGVLALMMILLLIGGVYAQMDRPRAPRRWNASKRGKYVLPD